MSKPDALLPCPFCGDNDPELTVDFGWHFCACTSGSDCMIRGPNAETEAEAVTAWNRRAGQAHTDGLVAALEEAKEALSNYACHGGAGAPCLRTMDQCQTECGKTAGDAYATVTAALTAAKGQQ